MSIAKKGLVRALELTDSVLHTFRYPIKMPVAPVVGKVSPHRSCFLLQQCSSYADSLRSLAPKEADHRHHCCVSDDRLDEAMDGNLGRHRAGTDGTDKSASVWDLLSDTYTGEQKAATCQPGSSADLIKGTESTYQLVSASLNGRNHIDPAMYKIDGD